MNQLVCEMCGGTDLVKQEGVFVCQSCGTKYSVEEARRMMIEGTVEVAGTVKVDNTTKLDNLFSLARRAREDGNRDKAIQYYEQILMEEPNSWEAAFYSTFYSSIQSHRNDETGKAIKLLRGCIYSVINLVKNTVEDESEQESILRNIAENIDVLCVTFFNDTADILINLQNSSDSYGYTSEQVDRRRRLYQHVGSIFIDASQVLALLGFTILELFGDNHALEILANTYIDQSIRMVNASDYEMTFMEVTTYSVHDSQKKTITSEYNQQRRLITEQNVKRRTDEYWKAHQTERTKLESEKESLVMRLAALNEEIPMIPQNTDGYSHILELQEKVKSLTADKANLGIFKIKEKRAIDQQIESVNAEISPIQARIDSAIAEVKERISPIESRIEAIDTELTMPR